MVGRPALGEQPQLQPAQPGERDVAGGLDPVGERPDLVERLLVSVRARPGSPRWPRACERELGDAAPLAEGDAFPEGVECGLRPLVAASDDAGEVVVDDGGFAAQALLERELERPAHILEAFGFPQLAAGEAAEVEREAGSGSPSSAASASARSAAATASG